MGTGLMGTGLVTGTGVQPAFRLSDSRLVELSGIASGIRSPGVYYAQNDSGDSARFFALDAKSGDVRAVYQMPGATNHDWEDLAVARDARGVPSVWLADIGDNDSQRSRIELYRVDEPAVPSSGATLRTTRPQVWTLRYPDGAHDAESLAVSPTGVPYLVTKDITGHAEVFVAPASPTGSTVRTLNRVASVDVLLATGAAFSRDGTRFVVRNYSSAYIWDVGSGDLSSALTRPPRIVALPSQPQGEGVCFDGSSNDTLVLDSEGTGSEVYRVRLQAPVTSSQASRTGAGSTHSVIFGLLLGAAVLVMAVVLLVPRRARRRGGRAGSGT